MYVCGVFVCMCVCMCVYVGMYGCVCACMCICVFVYVVARVAQTTIYLRQTCREDFKQRRCDYLEGN